MLCLLQVLDSCRFSTRRVQNRSLICIVLLQERVAARAAIENSLRRVKRNLAICGMELRPAGLTAQLNSPSASGQNSFHLRLIAA